MNEAVAGDETVAVDDLFVHAEVAGAMADKFVELLKSAFVEKQVDALPGGEFTFLVLAGAAFGAASSLGVGVAAAEFVKTVGHKRLA